MKPLLRARSALGRAVLAATAIALGGCASFSDDGGFDRVTSLTRERTGQSPAWRRHDADRDAAAARTAELLRQPLDADGAVEIALLNNPRLQAAFAELGIAESALVEAGRLRGPEFRFGRLAGGGIVEIDRALVFDVVGLFTLPAATRLEGRRFERVQFEAAGEAVRLAADTRRAWIDAVAARQSLDFRLQAQDATDAAADLARRLQEAGNFSALESLRQQAFGEDAALQTVRARQQAVATRERLVRLLGLGDAHARLVLVPRLPALPAAPPLQADAERVALERRLDVLAARRAAEAEGDALGLAQSTRWIDGLSAGPADKRSTGAARQGGGEVDVRLPLFDVGGTRAARAGAVADQARQRAAAAVLQARSEAREAQAATAAAFEAARRWRDEIVPARQRVVDESLLHYNGMLTSVFTLLADARAAADGVAAGIEALRDFWNADTDLQFAVQAPVAPMASATTIPNGASR